MKVNGLSRPDPLRGTAYTAVISAVVPPLTALIPLILKSYVNVNYLVAHH